MNINTQAVGLDMTTAINTYATEKITSLTKYHEAIESADVTVGQETHHHQHGKIFYCEVNLHVAGTHVHVRKDAEDLYKAIDKVRDHLKVELEKVKGKAKQVDRALVRGMKGYEG